VAQRLTPKTNIPALGGDVLNDRRQYFLATGEEGWAERSHPEVHFLVEPRPKMAAHLDLVRAWFRSLDLNQRRPVNRYETADELTKCFIGEIARGCTRE